MFGPVPGNIIELDRLLIILVAVTAEFERLKRCLGPNPIGNNMIQGPGLWIGSMFQTEGTGTGKKTRSTLSMHIRPRLKGTIQAGHQGNLILQDRQRFHRGGQLQIMQTDPNI